MGGVLWCGLVVGFVVGLTGVGGGSLMTPILLWFGINPATTVGTDLQYACITKMGGVWVCITSISRSTGITGWRRWAACQRRCSPCWCCMACIWKPIISNG